MKEALYRGTPERTRNAIAVKSGPRKNSCGVERVNTVSTSDFQIKCLPLKVAVEECTESSGRCKRGMWDFESCDLRPRSASSHAALLSVEISDHPSNHMTITTILKRSIHESAIQSIILAQGCGIFKRQSEMKKSKGPLFSVSMRSRTLLFRRPASVPSSVFCFCREAGSLGF